SDAPRLPRSSWLTLTPALSLSEGEGGVPIPSPPEGERVAVRAEPLASSGEARAEMIRGTLDGAHQERNRGMTSRAKSSMERRILSWGRPPKFIQQRTWP